MESFPEYRTKLNQINIPTNCTLDFTQLNSALGIKSE
jgi:hypothetical protein